MSNIDDRLRSDAARIEVTVPTSVRERVAQRLSAAEQKTSSEGKGVSGWWPALSSGWGPQLATGMLVVVALAAWLTIATDRPEEGAFTDSTQVFAEASTTTSEGAATDYQDPVTRLAGVMAGQGAPEAELQNELQSLNADWRRIRSRVRNQIDPLL